MKGTQTEKYGPLMTLEDLQSFFWQNLRMAIENKDNTTVNKKLEVFFKNVLISMKSAEKRAEIHADRNYSNDSYYWPLYLSEHSEAQNTKILTILETSAIRHVQDLLKSSP